MTVTQAMPANAKPRRTKDVLKTVFLVLGIILCVLGVYALISYNRKDMDAANAAAILAGGQPLTMMERLLYILYSIRIPVLAVGVLTTVVSLIVPSTETEAVYGSGKRYWVRLGHDIIRDRWLYLLLLPGLLYFLCFQVSAHVGHCDFFQEVCAGFRRFWQRVCGAAVL